MFLLNAVALLSMQAQIQAGATNNKPSQMLQYGPEGPVDPTKCTAVCFIPGSEGTVFAAAHLSGTVIIHIKVIDIGKWDASLDYHMADSVLSASEHVHEYGTSSIQTIVRHWSAYCDTLVLLFGPA